MKARRSLLAALVVMSLVLLGVPRVGLAADLPSDVVGTKYEEAVRLLSGIGVMKGYNDLTFRPEAPVKRSEMAKILVYSLGLGGVGEASMGKTGYKDVSEDSWASGYVNVADTKGLIKGVGNDLFAPDRSVSYAEAATMLIRLLGRESEVAGSFPTGQIALAVRWGLTQDTAFMGDQPARRGDIALMVYKALYEIPDLTGKTLASTVFGFGRAARIEVTPATTSVAVGQTVQFQAVAYDAGGKAVAITPAWSVGGSLGIVDKTGAFIATGPGTGKITASAEGLTATADLTVYGTPVKLSVTASQTTMPSNNSSTSVLTATMLDANGNKVANGRGKITFTVIDASLGHMDASVIDAVDGVATATFTSTTIPGIEQIYVSGSNVQGASVTISTTSPMATTVVLTPGTARLASDGASRTTITATIKDATGAPIYNNTGATVGVAITNSSPSVANLWATTILIPPGAYEGQTTVSSTTMAGTAAIAGFAGNLSVQGFTLSTGPVGAATQLKMRPVATETAADGVSQVRVYVEIQDSAGYVVTNERSTQIQLTATSGICSILSPIVMPDGGVATFVLTSSVAGDVQLKASAVAANFVPGTGSARFKAGLPAYLTLEAEPATSMAADGVSHLTLVAKVKDATGNLVAGAVNAVSFTRTTAVGALVLPAVTTVNAAGGIARLQVTSSAVTGLDTFKASSLGLTDSNTINLTTAITGLPVKVQVQTIGGSNVGRATTVQVYMLDTLNHRVTNNALAKSISLLLTGSATYSGPQTTVDGVATFTLNDYKAENITVRAIGDGLAGDSTGQAVNFAAAPGEKIILRATPQAISADGSSRTTITGVLLDPYGNELPSGQVVVLSMSGGTPASLGAGQFYTSGGNSWVQAGTTVGSVTISGTSTMFPVQPITISFYAPGEPTKVVVEPPTSVSAGTGTGSSMMTIRVLIEDANNNVVTGSFTDPNLSVVGLTVSGATGTTFISTAGEYGLTPAGFTVNATTKGSSRVNYGVAVFNYYNNKAETVTFTPIVIYKGTPLPATPAVATTVPGVPDRLTVSSSRAMMPADGTSTAVIEAKVTDAYGNVAKNFSDTITLSYDTAAFLSVPAVTPGGTIDGVVSYTLTSLRHASGGVTNFIVRGAAFSSGGVGVTIATDAWPSQPVIDVTDNLGVDRTIGAGETAARVTVTVSARNTNQTVRCYVNGVERTLYAWAGGATPAGSIAPGGTTFTGFVNRADLGTLGSKEFRVVVINGIGVSPLSDGITVNLSSP